MPTATRDCEPFIVPGGTVYVPPRYLDGEE